ncbi:MAG TPA: class B sortase [Lachnospiraceae bacterium]|nr:class B sortase [Lachnospiraceae bacterium]
MNTGKLRVLGRQFRTTADYEAACKDAELIEQVKKRYDLARIEEQERLIRDMKAEKYRFRTIIGLDFLEEMEEFYKKRKENLVEQKKVKTKTFKVAKKGSPQKKDVHLEDYDKQMQDSILNELKKREKIRKFILSFCTLVASGCFIYIGIYTYQTKRLDDYASIQQNLKGVENNLSVTSETAVIHYDDQEIVVPDILDEYKTLYSLNKKLIGWIKIDDTYIDYPVLQTRNNEYYLDHNFDQEQDKNGSIFLDKDCSILPRSTNLIIYGHHMQSGRMFGQLVKYSSEDFYKEHKYIQFDTIYEKGTYEVMFVFRSQIFEESKIIFKYYQFIEANSEIEFNSYMSEMTDMSLYETGATAEFGDQLLTLSTCDYFTDYGRFVVVAKKTK